MNIYKILPLVGVLILGVQGHLLSQEAADMMEGDGSGEMFDLSIEELMELPVEVSCSLTGSTAGGGWGLFPEAHAVRNNDRATGTIVKNARQVRPIRAPSSVVFSHR